MDETAVGADEFRTTTGRVLTWLTSALCALGLVGIAVQRGVLEGVRWAPFLALSAGACWALFARPRVIVDPAGVTLVNVLRTITVPWPAVIEVETRWGLTLVTPYGRFTAWAAPAPGAAHALRNSPKREGRHLPTSTYRGGAVRVGDLPTSPSGSAAMIVRTWWERLQREGVLDHPQLEFERPPTRWHRRTLLVGAVLVAACVVTLVV